MKIKVRPAGLEPATLCLEVRSEQVIETSLNIEVLYSISYKPPIEACGKFLTSEDVTIYKLSTLPLYAPTRPR
jgi:hypothetical protein